jgi:serine/threonine protein kinase
MQTILSTIKYAYTKHSVVHLVLKPENLLLEGRRDIEQLKLIGFGNAIVAPQRKYIVDPKTQKLPNLVGTPTYMSPESLQYQTYSHKSDIWACGVIAYQTLAGYLPFEGADDRETLELILNSK